MSITKVPAVVITSMALILSQSALAESAKARFKAEVGRIAELSVSNESKPDGDILTPKHSVGFTGSYRTRKEVFEESRRLTKTLEKLIAFNPNGPFLYPGSLVQGKSLPDGVLAPLVAPRKKQECTVTGLAGADPKTNFSRQIVPTLANVTKAVNEILTQNLAQAQPARMTFSSSTFSTISQGLLQLGADYRWLGGGVNGSFTQHNAESRTQLMVRFVQSYYTVSCALRDPDPLAIFPASTDFAQLLSNIGDGNPPAYVSEVTYGRELWMLVESSRNEQEVKDVFDAAISLGMSNGKVEFSSEQKSIIADSSIQVLLIGGGGKPAVGVVTGDPSQLQSYLNAGANFSTSSPGSPISYTVRYLRNNEVARVSSTQDYVVRTAENSPVAAPLQWATVTWRTTGDDKNWNTQAVVDVYDQAGANVAHLDCCSGDRSTDKWERGRVHTANLIVRGGTDATLEHGRLNAVRNPAGGGNDDWDYELTITLTFADNSRVTHTASGRNNFSANW